MAGRPHTRVPFRLLTEAAKQRRVFAHLLSLKLPAAVGTEISDCHVPRSALGTDDSFSLLVAIGIGKAARGRVVVGQGSPAKLKESFAVPDNVHNEVADSPPRAVRFAAPLLGRQSR